MKKVSTAVAKQNNNCSQQKLTIGLNLEGSVELVLRVGRSRRQHKVKIFRGRNNKAQSRVPVTALIARPSFIEPMERKVDNQVAAPAETRTPNWHERNKSLNRECGWKGGDSCHSAGEKTCPTKNKDLTPTGLLMEGDFAH